MNHKETQHKKRTRRIHFLYKYELLNEKLSLNDAFENYNFNESDINSLDDLIKNYDDLKKIVESNLKDTWSWDRIMPLERAILIVGAYELKHFDKGIVINEMVIYSKEYLLEDKYRFINAILQKINDQYEKSKI